MVKPAGLNKITCYVLFLVLTGFSAYGAAEEKAPVFVGIDAEFGLENSVSAQAIELGVRAAIKEINAAGGVLKGRPVELILRDNRSIPARAVRNIDELSKQQDMVAVFGGRFSPVAIEVLPKIQETGLIYLAVWSAADPIIDNGMQPNYVFRLSMRDSLAMPKMLKSAQERGFSKVGLLLTNTSWGRSSFLAAEKYAARARTPEIVQTAWYNWRDLSFVDKYQKLTAAGVQAVILVGNDDEGGRLIREIAALPAKERVPVISHWGITGGELPKLAGPGLHQVDLTVLQTFSFFNAKKEVLEKFMMTVRSVSDIKDIAEIQAPVGVAQAYDMMHILAKAINLAGTTKRSEVRTALERVPEHRGLIKHYKPPFTATRHEALGPNELIMARYRADNALVPVTMPVKN